MRSASGAWKCKSAAVAIRSLRIWSMRWRWSVRHEHAPAHAPADHSAHEALARCAALLADDGAHGSQGDSVRCAERPTLRRATARAAKALGGKMTKPCIICGNGPSALNLPALPGVPIF